MARLREVIFGLGDWAAGRWKSQKPQAQTPAPGAPGRKLRINVRTVEKWEQGRAKPNPQAAALVLLVRKYPDTRERLEKVAAG